MRIRELPLLMSLYKTPNGIEPFDKKNPCLLDNAKILISFMNPDIEVMDVKEGKHRKMVVSMKCTCGKVYDRELCNIDRARTALLCLKCANIERGKKDIQDHLKKKLAVIESKGYKVLSDVTNGIGQYDRLLLETKEGYRVYKKYISLTLKSEKTKDIFSMENNRENFIYNANVFCKNNNLKTKVLDFSEKQLFAHPSVRCQCECGNYFDTSIYSLTIDEKTRCNQCTIKQSKWCKKVEEFLEENKLTYSNEVFLKGCKDKRLLPFDYQLDINKGLIEVDGEQHFIENGYSMGADEEETANRFKLRKRHDAIKDNFCKKNGYKLLRISYKDVLKGTYKNMILDFIS